LCGTYLNRNGPNYQQKEEKEVESMSMTPQEYDKLTKQHSPNTRSGKTIPLAWLFGGGICCIGQAFGDLYRAMGAGEELVPMLVSVTLVALASLLTGIGVFDDIASVGGAGCLVPITGFSNAVTAPALDFKSEGFVLGLGAKMFVIAGPVIVYGVVASVVYGLIYWITTLFQ
jgi:stage V sporulation protein AC